MMDTLFVAPSFRADSSSTYSKGKSPVTFLFGLAFRYPCEAKNECIAAVVFASSTPKIGGATVTNSRGP